MKTPLNRQIRHRGTDLFENKSEAIALKKLVKACFAPQFIYPQESATSSPPLQRVENGPSFIGTDLGNPRAHREGRLSVKAFISKKLKHNICEQVRREMEAVRDQTEEICYRLRNTHVPMISRTSSVQKCSTASTTHRSTVEMEPKRIIFKLQI